MAKKLTKSEMDQRGIEYRYAYMLGYDSGRKDERAVHLASPSFCETLIAIGDQKAVKKIMAWALKEQETPKSGTSDKDALAIMQYCGHGVPPAVRIVERCNNGVVVKSIHGLFLVKFNGGVWVGVESMSPGYVPPKAAQK